MWNALRSYPLHYVWRQWARLTETQCLFLFQALCNKALRIILICLKLQVQFPIETGYDSRELVRWESYWQMRAGNGASRQDNANQPLITRLYSCKDGCRYVYMKLDTVLTIASASHFSGIFCLPVILSPAPLCYCRYARQAFSSCTNNAIYNDNWQIISYFQAVFALKSKAWQAWCA